MYTVIPSHVLLAIFAEYLTNVVSPKTFAWLASFLATAQVQFHQSVSAACTVMFLQRAHVILDYFPSAPDLDLFGFGKINIETFLFFPPSRVMSSYWIFYSGLGWLLHVWTLPDAQLTYQKRTHGGAVSHYRRVRRKNDHRGHLFLPSYTHRHSDKSFRLNIFTFIKARFSLIRLDTQVWHTIL